MPWPSVMAWNGTYLMYVATVAALLSIELCLSTSTSVELLSRQQRSEGELMSGRAQGACLSRRASKGTALMTTCSYSTVGYAAVQVPPLNKPCSRRMLAVKRRFLQQNVPSSRYPSQHGSR